MIPASALKEFTVCFVSYPHGMSGESVKKYIKVVARSFKEARKIAKAQK